VEILLTVTLFVSILAFFVPKKFIKEFSLAFSATFFLFTCSLLAKYDVSKDFNFVYFHEFLKDLGGSFYVGVDGIGFSMVLLTNFVVLFISLMSWDKDYDSSFHGLVFLMQFALLGVFSSMNALLFYFFWELALIPIYFIVFKWGQGEEIQKTFTRFFVVTFVGSLCILAAFILILCDAKVDSLDIKSLMPVSMNGEYTIYYSILLFIGFGVKIPIFPLHSWQADTYSKSPSEGTILLSGIMLKMGLFGLFKWFMPFQNDSPASLTLVFVILSSIGVLYGAFIALRRNDLKLIAAFSSLSHVGMIAAGILVMKVFGFQGAAFQMVVHGINIVGIFYMIDIIEQTTGSRQLSDLGGIATKAPAFAILSFIIILGSIAVPLTNGFPGEMLLLLGIYLYNPIIGILVGLSIIIGAAYMLRVFQLAFFGEESTAVSQMKPINSVHLYALGFICVLVLALGLFPQYLMDMTASTAQYLINLIEIKK